MHWWSPLFTAVTHSHLSGLGFVFAIAFLESVAFIGLLFPGTVLILGAVGFLYVYKSTSLFVLIIVAALGAILGDTFSFYLGRRGKRWAGQRTTQFFKASHLERGEEFLKRHGPKSIFLARFIGPIRPLVPFVAGLFRMDSSVFLFWNILSGIVWAIVSVFLGAFFGHAWRAIETWTTRVGFLALSLVLLFGLIYFFKKFVVEYGKWIYTFFRFIFRRVRRRVFSYRWARSFVQRYPTLFFFVKQRFDRRHFFGLPVTLFALAFVYIGILFFGIVEEVLLSETLVSLDIRLSHLFLIFRSPLFTEFFLWITLLGSFPVVFLFALLISLLLLLRKRGAYLLPFWTTLLGSECFNLLGKWVFHRPRPEMSAYLEKSFSFPSGHSTGAVAFYGFLVYLLMRRTRHRNEKINIFFLGLLVVLLIGLSRLYLGVHFLSDVLGGYLLGLLWLIIGISVAEWIRLGDESLLRPGFIPTLKNKVAVWLLILSSFLFYVGFAYRYSPPLNPIRQDTFISLEDSSLTPLLFSNYQLPRYTENLLGDSEEPIGFMISVPTADDLASLFEKAGWHPADSVDPFSFFSMAKAVVTNQPYNTAPIAPAFWNAQTHDFAFEKPTNLGTVRQRHRLRLWDTHLRTSRGHPIYVGAVALDQRLRKGLRHIIDPNLDREREFLFQDLKASGVPFYFERRPLVPPLRGKKIVGGSFFTDGKFYIFEF